MPVVRTGGVEMWLEETDGVGIQETDGVGIPETDGIGIPETEIDTASDSAAAGEAPVVRP